MFVLTCPAMFVRQNDQAHVVLVGSDHCVLGHAGTMALLQPQMTTQQ
jgi:hypothetical protein